MPAIPIIAAVGSSVIGAVGSKLAANTQAGAAKSAAQLQAESAQNALDFQKQMWGTQQQNMAPWLQAGQGAIGQLSQLAQNYQPWTQQFQAPTAATEQNDPGYQFRLQQGNEALQNSAAARGNLLTGGTSKAIQQYGQDYASNEYGNVYNRALGQYQQNYDIFQNNQTNQFNRLAAVAGAGQTAAGQLGSLGQSASGNVSNILLGSAGQIGQTLQNQGAATASGYAGMANALGGGLNNLAQNYQVQQLMKSLSNQYTYGPSPGQPGWPG